MRLHGYFSRGVVIFQVTVTLLAWQVFAIEFLVIFYFAERVDFAAHRAALAADFGKFKYFLEFGARSNGLKLPAHLLLFTVAATTSIVLFEPLV